MNRRKFLIGGATAAGALIVGYAFWPSRRLARADQLAAKSGERFVASWIKLANDGTITVVVPHCDMGTGIFTALSQMAADELDADWEKVRAETAPADPLFANGPLAEGFALERVNIRGDSIPGFLRGSATGSLRVLAEYLDVQTTGGSSAVRFTGVYGMRVAAAAAEYAPSAHPKLKSASEFRFIGRPVPRLDIPAKVNGSTHYGIDTQFPDMYYAAIRISPVIGGKLVSLDEAPIARSRGVKKVVRFDDAVVVVADRLWRARNAVEVLQPVFNNAGNENISSKTIRDAHLAALNDGKIKKDLTTGAGAEALKNGKLVERLYNVPYLAHAPMEPPNATALYKKDGTLEVWSGTQDGLGSRAFCAKAAGLSLDKVTFHLLPSGGGFGRRLPGFWNFLTYAVKTAMAVPGVPVKLVFTREQEMQHDFYRPNVTSRFKAVVSHDGMPEAWVNDYTTDEHPNPEAHIFYAVPNQAYATAKVAAYVPTGPWRSVEASWHGFFIESFIDELAHEAKKDPLEFRRALLQEKPRHLATLNLAAE